MLMLLNLMLQRVRDQRGVVSVEWIILGAVIMVAIVGAFAPALTTMLTAAVGQIGTTLSTQLGLAAAGSGS